MNTVQILLVAPYVGMAKLAEQIAAKRNDISINTIIGDLDTAVTLVSEIDCNNYDFIISRGGTADLLSHTTNIPVIHIQLSEYDMLRTLLLAKNCEEPHAIVGFQNIIKCVDLVNALLEVSIPTRILKSEKDAKPALVSLKESGITLIVGDTVTVTTAKTMGLNTILITSGEESISNAFDTAVRTKQAQIEADTKCAVLYEVLDHCSLDFITFNEEGQVVHQKCRLFDSKQLISLTSRHLNQLKKKGNFELSTKCGDTFVRLDGYTWQSEKNLYVFYCKISNPPNTQSITLMQRPLDELWINFLHFYCNCESTESLMRLTATMTQTMLPVLISGEAGTLIECFAWELYQNCPLHVSPCFLVDCSILTTKALHFLTENTNSPLYNNNVVIFIHNLHMLDLEKQHHFLTYIQNTSLNTRNRMIYSIDPAYHNTPIASYLLSSTSCQVLALPVLRDRQTEMKTLAGIYLNEINTRFGKQMLGIRPEALEALSKYNWPQNIMQFVRVLTVCALSSSNPLLDLSCIQTALQKELFSNNEQTNQIQLPTGTLEEITHAIVYQILKEENMNQSKTAQRLGISRSTLWRMLK